MDWAKAKGIHASKVDYVRNRKKLNDDLAAYWREWADRNYTHFANVSLEALRSMVLVGGAAIIAALAAISGQIASPPAPVVMVAKITVFSSIPSLLMMATGHAIIVERGASMTERVRGKLVGHVRHGQLYVIGRYVRMHISKLIPLANGLIYGSIAVFGISALISSIILMFAL